MQIYVPISMNSILPMQQRLNEIFFYDLQRRKKVSIKCWDECNCDMNEWDIVVWILLSAARVSFFFFSLSFWQHWKESECIVCGCNSLDNNYIRSKIKFIFFNESYSEGIERKVRRGKEESSHWKICFSLWLMHKNFIHNSLRFISMHRNLCCYFFFSYCKSIENAMKLSVWIC